MKNKNKKSFNRVEQKSKKQKPEESNGIPIYNYWLLSILAMITASMFRKTATLEIIFQGTNHTISFFTISLITILMSAFFAAIYYSLKDKDLNSRLTNLHTLLSLGVIGTVFLTAFKEELWDVDEILVTGVGVFIIAQGILIGNVLKINQ